MRTTRKIGHSGRRLFCSIFGRELAQAVLGPGTGLYGVLVHTVKAYLAIGHPGDGEKRCDDQKHGQPEGGIAQDVAKGLGRRDESVDDPLNLA